MVQLWNGEKDFPAWKEAKTMEGVEYVRVHTAVEGEYQFLLGAAIIRHKAVFYSSWGNSFRKENDNNTILAQRCSFDGGKSWQDYTRISDRDPGFGRSHGVYFEQDGRLYAFCPRARFGRIDAYPDLKTEGYVLDENNIWRCLGTVLDGDFWPMCEPLKLDNGTLLMAGLKTATVEASVALCGGDLTKWEMVVLPNPQGFEYWGETTVLKSKNKLTAIVRGGKGTDCALVSESLDGGRTWTGLEKSNFPIANSKMYAGTLADGSNYLVFNAIGDAYRDTLCIAVGRELFERVYLIRHGFDAPSRFGSGKQWCYPYAYEDRESGRLYVIYALNKEDCELAIIPTDSLRGE